MDELLNSPNSSPVVSGPQSQDTPKDIFVDKKGALQIGVSKDGRPPEPPLKLTPAEAVLAGEIIFPDEEEPWYQRTVSMPEEFEGATPPSYIDAEELSVPPFTYMVYAIFSGFLVLLVLIAVLAYVISLSPSDRTTLATPTPSPMVLCYFDPTMSTAFSPPFTRSDLCVECCSYFIYDGLEVDGQGNIKQRTGTGPAPVDTVQDWLELKRATDLKVLCGLRFQAPPSGGAADLRVAHITQTLHTSYAEWDGAAFIWTTVDAQKEIALYRAVRKEFGDAAFKIIAHISPTVIYAYNFTAMRIYTDVIVVETHNFAVHGRAYPPCMYESGGFMDVSSKNLVRTMCYVE
ncbi:uncharacterized protein LOC144118439, partial [Amblyomma americanum]